MATGRRGRKTTTKGKRKGKAAPARKKTRKKASKTKARTTKAKARVRTKPKAKPKRAAKPKARAAKRAAVAPRRRSRPMKAAPSPAPAPLGVAPAAAAPAAGDDMQRNVEQALRDNDYDPPDDTVVAVLTAIGTGYGEGPAQPPAWLQVDTAGPIAEAVVERFATGDRAHDIDRSTHRPQVRSTVNINLDQLGGESTGDAERDVLTSFCLGSWDPAMDTNAERNGIASFVIPWYLAGRA